MKRLVIALVVIAILIVGIVSTMALTNRLPVPGISSPGTSDTIVRVQSGLTASDPLNKFETQQQLQSNGSYWQFEGTGGSQSNYYSFFEDADQLHIGVSSANNGTWTGYYAVTPPTNASLVHAILTAPNASSINGYYDTGLYMQASNQYLNYLACLAISTPNGTVWGVVHAQGSTSANTVITPLWVDTTPNQPLTRDCTMISTGSSVQVYLDHVLVYQNNFLGISAPYSFFVEDETLVAGRVLYGQYQDFYVALGPNVMVNNVPSTAAVVDLVGVSGKVYASAPVHSGAATLDVANYTYPLSASIKAYSSASEQTNATLVGDTRSVQSVFGGDVYTFGKASSSVLTLNLQAEDSSGHDIDGMAVTLSTDRTVITSDYFPTQFSLNGSQTYTITAYDYGSYTFDHWSDGSTLRVLTLSETKSTSLVAYYRSVNATPPPGESMVSVSAVTPNGTALTGLTVTLWQNGILSGITYTPGGFYVQADAGAFVVPSNYGNYVFSHWSSGANNTAYAVPEGPTTIKLVAVYTKTG